MRLLRTPLALGLMAAFGFSVYWGLGHLSRASAQTVRRPTETSALISMPGSLYVIQHGQIYRLRGTTFSQLTSGEAGWMQPAVSPDGTRLAAVLRRTQYSDIYLLDAGGHPLANLTSDQGHSAAEIGENNWVFYPHFSPDGSSLIFSYDEPKILGDYRVDLAVWQLRLDNPKRRWLELTTPNFYTGGDTDPSRLGDAGVLYAAATIDDQSNVFSQILFTDGRSNHAVTTEQEDCGQPALSPDARNIALICGFQKSVADLVVAPLSGSTLGAPAIVVSDRLCAGPVWAPDGSGVAYMAPAERGGGFQLWWVPLHVGQKIYAPVQATQGLDLDATSPLAWHS